MWSSIRNVATITPATFPATRLRCLNHAFWPSRCLDEAKKRFRPCTIDLFFKSKIVGRPAHFSISTMNLRRSGSPAGWGNLQGKKSYALLVTSEGEAGGEADECSLKNLPAARQFKMALWGGGERRG